MDPNYAFGVGFSIVAIVVLVAAFVLYAAAIWAAIEERSFFALILGFIGGAVLVVAILLFGFEWATLSG